MEYFTCKIKCFHIYAFVLAYKCIHKKSFLRHNKNCPRSSVPWIKVFILNTKAM